MSQDSLQEQDLESGACTAPGAQSYLRPLGEAMGPHLLTPGDREAVGLVVAVTGGWQGLCHSSGLGVP